MFKMRREGRKQKLADLLEVMDFKNFGIMEINFRKCLCVTSIKGVNFFYIEIQSFTRIRKMEDKF